MLVEVNFLLPCTKHLELYENDSTTMLTAIDGTVLPDSGKLISPILCPEARNFGIRDCISKI